MQFSYEYANIVRNLWRTPPEWVETFSKVCMNHLIAFAAGDRMRMRMCKMKHDAKHTTCLFRFHQWSQIVCRTCRRVPMSGNCCGWFAVNVCFSSDWHFSKIAKSNEWILTFYELSSQEIGFSCLWRSNKNRRNFYYYLEIFFATANDLTTF